MIKNRLFKVFLSHSLPLLFVSFTIGIGAMTISYGFVTRNSEREAYHQLEQIQAYYEVVFEELDSLSLMFSTTTEIISLLERLLEMDKWSWEDAHYGKLIISYIQAPVNARPYIESIYVYLDNSKKRVLSSKNGFIPLSVMDDTSWFDTFYSDMKEPKMQIEYIDINENNPTNVSRPILRIYRTILDTRAIPKGVIILNLKADRLSGGYPSLFAGEDSFLVISNNLGERLLSIPWDQDINAGEKSNEYVKYQLDSRHFDLHYELNVPGDYLYRIPRTIGMMTIALSVFICILGILLANKTNQKETRFLKNVLAQFEAAGVSRLNQTPPGDRENIFDYLNSQILKSFLEQEYLRMQNEVMEYRTLQMQINPHFLYNTLETINWSAIALLSSPNDVSKMIQLLSRLLKYAMEITGNSGVPLSMEIEHTKYYLELQNYRFKAQFAVSWQIDEGLDSVLIPKLIFQPILENSFSHGYRDEKFPLRISISITASKDDINVIIEDNGKGMEEVTLNLLNEEWPETPNGIEFIGYANTRKRIQLFYKGNAKMSIASEKQKGTKIIISFPALYSPVDNGASIISNKSFKGIKFGD